MLNKYHQNFELLTQFLSYLSVVRGLADKTISEYRSDIFMFFQFISESSIAKEAESPMESHCIEFKIDINLIKSITLSDMYSFISYCHNVRKSSVATKVRKIVAIRQFWKYLKTKVHLIENNIAEELEIPQIPKRVPKYLSLEDSVRLLISCESTVRNYCIITLFLNCALRLSELVNINLSQLNSDVLTIIGKGNKERKIFLTPATKKAIYNWLPLRKTMIPAEDALFITRKGTRITKRAVQDMIKKILESFWIRYIQALRS